MTEYELTREQVLEIVDAHARRLLDMTGNEFTTRLDAGTLPHSSVVEYLASLAGDSLR
jgi:hypothetical protein